MCIVHNKRPINTKKCNSRRKKLKNTTNLTNRVTRSYTKKMDYYSFTSIPTRKSKNAIKSKKPSLQQLTTENKENDLNSANTKNVQVLYKVDEKSFETKEENIPKLEIAQQSTSTHCDFGLVPANLANEDHKVINDVLDFMEKYGILDVQDRASTFEDINTDLETDCEELQATIQSLTENREDMQ